MICNSCSTERDTKTAVLKGIFGQYCQACIQGDKRSANAGHAEYSRNRDREDNAKDLLQPWDRAGKPNREFIKNYPEEAGKIFTPKQLRDNE